MKIVFYTLSFLSITIINAAEVFTDIDHIQTLAPTSYTRVLKLEQYNVDNALRSERAEVSRWFNRSKRVYDSITQQNADIVSLNELRELDDRLPVKMFLAQFNQYNHIYNRKNPNKIAFGQAILFNPDKLYPLESLCKWLSETPNQVSDYKEKGLGTMVLCVKFAHVEKGKIIRNMAPLWVFNVHFPAVGEEAKTACCYKLIEVIKGIAQGEPYVVLGDFNTYFDMDGFKQRSILSENMLNITDNLETEAGKKVTGTFIGTDLDEQKKPFPLAENMSQLDYIYIAKDNPYIQRVEDKATVVTKTMLEVEPEELTSRQLPSDHLPVLASIKVFSR